MNDLLLGVLFWSGLAVVTGAILYINYRMLKKRKIVDERFQTIHTKGRSYGWMGSTAIIFIVWFLSLVVFESLLAFWLITAIWVGHMLSYLIGAAVAQSEN